MTKKRITALILLILAVIVLIDFRMNGMLVIGNYFKKLSPDFVKQASANHNLEQSDAPRSSRQGSLTVNYQDLTRLQLNNPQGDVKIYGRQQDKIEVEYKITVYGQTEKLAREFSSQVQVESRLDKQQVTIGRELPKQPERIKGVEIDYRITAPQDLKLKLKTNAGELEVSGFTSPADLAVNYGQLTVSDLQAGAVIEGNYCEGKLAEIDGKLNVESNFSALELKQIAASTEIESNYGELNLAASSGDIKLDSSYAGVNASKLTGKLNGELRYGALNIRGISNSLDIESEYGAVNLGLSPQLTDYSLDIIANRGAINTNLNLSVIKEEDKQKLQELTDSKVQIKVRTKRGEVKIIKGGE